jgi:flagellin
MEVTVGLSGTNGFTFEGPASEDDYAAAGVVISNGSLSNGVAGVALTLADYGFDALDPAQTTAKEYTTKTVDELVTEINLSSGALFGKVRASNDNGKLRIENQSTQDLTVDGITAGGAIDGTATGNSTILGNSVRAGLTSQFNELRDQLDKLSDDASFNGINLLRGDKLTITFNETGTSAIDIQTENGETINAFNLGVPTQLEEEQLDSDVTIDGLLTDVKAALDEVRSQASTFGSNLSIVQNRKSFTEAMINTLETGAGNLTLADMNTEAANLLALQTRQQLSQNSLSLASQADQSILQLLQ